MTASIVLTAILIALVPAARYLRLSATGANRERRLLLATTFNILVVASYYYIARYTAVGRNLYCIFLMLSAFVYFGAMEGYRVIQARMRSGDSLGAVPPHPEETE